MKVKPNGESLVGLSLHLFKVVSNERSSVLLSSSGCNIQTINLLSSKFDKVIMPHQVTKSPGWIIQESSLSMNGYTLTEINAVCYKSLNPRQRQTSRVPDDDEETVTGVSSNFDAILGHIKITDSKDDPVFPPSAAWLVEGQKIRWTPPSMTSKYLSVKIKWKLRDGMDSASYPKYNMFFEQITKREALNRKRVEGGRQFLGVAVTEAFYVSDFAVSSEAARLRFIIQVCNVDGSSQKLDECPSLLLDVEGSWLCAYVSVLEH